MKLDFEEEGREKSVHIYVDILRLYSLIFSGYLVLFKLFRKSEI